MEPLPPKVGRAPKATQRIQDYTEHAMTVIDKTVPTIGYVPPAKRPNKKFVLVLRDAPLDVKVNVERIAMADPIGFLAAIVNGQPVEEFVVNKVTGEATRNWVTADLAQRVYIAKYFADKLVPYMTRTRLNDIDAENKKNGGDEDEYAAMIAGAQGGK